MRGTVPPLLQYIFVAWCLVKHSDNFTFTLPFFVSVQNLKELCIASDLLFPVW
jgi:hypothetical protein